MTSRKQIAVAGATGRVGRHVVDVLEQEGHDVVAMSRSGGVDVITGELLADALVDVDSVIDVATGASPEHQAATEFFTTAARNLHREGERAGVQRIVVVSIIGTDHFTAGYGAAKLAHERAMLAGPVPVHPARSPVSRVRRAARRMGTRGRCQLHAGDAHAAGRRQDCRTGARRSGDQRRSGAEPRRRRNDLGDRRPREESMVEIARLLVARRGDPARIEAAGDTGDPDRDLAATDLVLPGPNATLAGPTFQQWLDSTTS